MMGSTTLAVLNLDTTSNDRLLDFFPPASAHFPKFPSGSKSTRRFGSEVAHGLSVANADAADARSQDTNKGGVTGMPLGALPYLEGRKAKGTLIFLLYVRLAQRTLA